MSHGKIAKNLVALPRDKFLKWIVNKTFAFPGILFL